MDHRIAERRHKVSEDKARGRLRILLWMVGAATVVGMLLWLVTSPLLSIRTITVTGADRSDPGALAASVGAEVGIPTITVRTGSIERAVAADPWISDARATVSWPGTIEIDVVERTPVASIATPDGAFLVAVDGTLLERADTGVVPPVIETDSNGSLRPGDRVDRGATQGAVTFLGALPTSLRRAASVTVTGDTVNATVAGIRIVIGRPIDMEAKAAAVAALLNDGIDPGSEINVTAPTRPAVAPPQSQLEGETTEVEESQPSD